MKENLKKEPINPSHAQSMMDFPQKFGKLEKIQEEKVSEDCNSKCSKKSKMSKRSYKSMRNKENNIDQLNSSSFSKQSKHSKKSQISNKADTKKRTFHNLMMDTGGYGIGGNNFLGSKLSAKQSFLNMNSGGSRSEMNYKMRIPAKNEPKSNKSNMTSFSNMSVGTFFHLVNKPAL